MSPAVVLTVWDASTVFLLLVEVEGLVPFCSTKLILKVPQSFCLFAVEVTWEQTNRWLSVAEIRTDLQHKQG